MNKRQHRPTTTPRFLYFDLGNVLVDFDHDLMCRQLAALGSASVESVKAMIFGTGSSNGGQNGGVMRQIEIGELSQDAWYHHFCAAAKSDASLPDFLYAAGAIFSIKLDMIPVIAQLVAAKQPIGILSNTCQPHWDYVSDGRYGMIPSLFDVLVLSYQVHSAKPDRAIYDIAAQMAGYDPSDILFVDDRPENVEGAKLAGFEAIPFTNARQFVSDLRKYQFRFNL